MLNQLLEYVLSILWFAASFTLAILVIMVWCAFVFFVVCVVWSVMSGIYYYIQDIKKKTKKIETSIITIDKEILIDSLCEKFGITERKMRRAIDRAMKFEKQRSALRHELFKKDPHKENSND